jgi:hypothetical protein
MSTAPAVLWKKGMIGSLGLISTGGASAERSDSGTCVSAARAGRARRLTTRRNVCANAFMCRPL